MQQPFVALLAFMAGVFLATLKVSTLTGWLASLLACLWRGTVNVAWWLDALPNHLLWSLCRADEIPHGYYRSSDYWANRSDDANLPALLLAVVAGVLGLMVVVYLVFVVFASMALCARMWILAPLVPIDLYILVFVALVP